MEVPRVAALAVLAALSACSSIKPHLVDGRLPETLDERPERRGYYESLGIGAADPSLPTDTQRKALARDAAIVKAQYEMLSFIKGVELSGGYTISEALSVDSSLETRIKETIRGAQILRSEFTADGGCVVTLRLSKKRLATQAGLALR